MKTTRKVGELMLNYLLILNALLLLAAIVLLWRNHQRLVTQQIDIQPLLEIAPPPAGDVSDLLGEVHPRLISVEIHNPLQLAAREQALAGLLGNLAPGMIRREVYRQAASMIRQELEKWEVAAEVRVHAQR